MQLSGRVKASFGGFLLLRNSATTADNPPSRQHSFFTPYFVFLPSQLPPFLFNFVLSRGNYFPFLCFFFYTFFFYLVHRNRYEDTTRPRGIGACNFNRPARFFCRCLETLFSFPFYSFSTSYLRASM